MSIRLEGGSRRRSQDALGAPLVSILVVVLKARTHLPELLESIFEHEADDLELIVIDGGSQDGTIEYLRTHAAQIDFWLSEPDRGIYDAMNKAVERATGTFLLHLNVGDRLLHLPREELEQARDAAVDLLSFPVALSDRRQFRPSYGLSLRFRNTLHHQGTFYRRTSFLPYDSSYRIFADFDVNQRLAISGSRAWIGRQVVAFHATDGVSGHKNPAGIKEFLSVIRKNHGDRAVSIARIMGKWRGLKSKLNLA